MTHPQPAPAEVHGCHKPHWHHLGQPKTRIQFTTRMALHLMKATGMRAREALRSAGIAMLFFEDCGMHFGDPAYAWDDAAARTLVFEYWRDQ